MPIFSQPVETTWPWPVHPYVKGLTYWIYRLYLLHCMVWWCTTQWVDSLSALIYIYWIILSNHIFMKQIMAWKDLLFHPYPRKGSLLLEILLAYYALNRNFIMARTRRVRICLYTLSETVVFYSCHVAMPCNSDHLVHLQWSDWLISYDIVEKEKNSYKRGRGSCEKGTAKVFCSSTR